jgi:3-methyladenine DNA glycosylase AlkC
MPKKLKDMFYQKPFIESLTDALKEIYPNFDGDRFLAQVINEGWETLELKEKMRHVTRCLHDTLPENFLEALDIIRKIAPRFTGFDAMIFPDYVESYGQDHFDESMSALAEFNKCCSSEFGVRPFLAKDPERGMACMNRWAESEDSHLRRLASEGCRPRLPWAMALPAFKKDPTPIIPILEKLRDDESESVRRSVANNLNDISKDNPEAALNICENWKGISKKSDWIVKHACRDMLKSGNKRALILFGFADPKNLHIENLSFEKESLPIGDDMRFSFDLNVDTETTCSVRLEYAVYYVKAKGKLSRKVFQIKEYNYEPGLYSISRKISFQDQSTRKHYPGEHHIAVLVNGEEKDKKPLNILPA